MPPQVAPRQPLFSEACSQRCVCDSAGWLPRPCLPQNGIRIGGEKYMMVAGEPGEVLRGKKGAGEKREGR